MFRSTGLRLAAAYTVAFTLAVALLGLITILSTRAALTEQFDERLRADQISVIDGYREQGLTGVLREIGEASAGPGALQFGVQDENGKPIAGPLAAVRAPDGFSTTPATINGRVLALKGGARSVSGLGPNVVIVLGTGMGAT